MLRLESCWLLGHPKAVMNHQMQDLSLFGREFAELLKKIYLTVFRLLDETGSSPGISRKRKSRK